MPPPHRSSLGGARRARGHTGHKIDDWRPRRRWRWRWRWCMSRWLLMTMSGGGCGGYDAGHRRTQAQTREAKIKTLFFVHHLSTLFSVCHNTAAQYYLQLAACCCMLCCCMCFIINIERNINIRFWFSLLLLQYILLIDWRYCCFRLGAAACSCSSGKQKPHQ